MRVALVCDFFLPRRGGVEYHVRDLAIALRANGMDAVVVTTTPGESIVDGIPVIRIAVPLVPGAGFAYTPSMLRKLSKTMFDERFDVVHAHASIFTPTAYAGAAIAARMGIPTVLTLHSMLYRSSMVLGAADALLAWTDHVRLTAVSSVVAAQAVRWMPRASISVLPNAIDVAFWRSGERVARDEGVLFVSAMRLSRKKRPHALLHAFADAVRVASGSPDLRLTIAGEGPDRADLLRLARELGIDDRVVLAGQLTREELRTLYARAQVFVLPSERESFGLAALEARAAGLPVIAMVASGARDFIISGLNGLLARDHNELGRFMTRLALDEPYRSAMAGRNASSPPPYDWGAVGSLHRDLYEVATANA